MAFNPTITEDMLEWFLAIGSPSASTARWVSFHNGDPSTTGANETGVLARVQHDLWQTGTPGDGKVSNSGAGQSAAASGSDTISHYGLLSANTAGTYYWGGALTGSVAVNNGDTVSWADGALEASIT